MTAPAAPRLLFLCHTLPYPPDGGVWMRTYHVLAALSEGFRVTALFFERTGQPDHDVAEARSALAPLCEEVRIVPLPQNESSSRFLSDHVLSLVTGRVFTYHKHRSEEFLSLLDRELETGRYDLVHMDSLDLSVCLPRLEGHRVVCVHHNVESQLLERRAEGEENPLLRWYFRRQARLQLQEERRWCASVDLNVTVSEEDRDELLRRVPGSEVAVVPNGVDVEEFRPPPGGGGQRGVVFVGGAGWYPNLDGMEFFCREVLPGLRDRVGEVPVHWIGRAEEEVAERFRRDFGVRMHGYVDDIRPIVESAACFIVPLRIGGGSRLKILVAWAMGKAVVSTAVGCEGLVTEDGRNIAVRDEPAAFADAVSRVLEDPDHRARLGSAGRKTAVGTYSWKKIGEGARALYASLPGDGER